MSRYLLLMRGDQSNFVNCSEEEQKNIIADYTKFSDDLDKSNKMIYGDGCSYNSILLKGNEVSNDPFVETDKQLSGFFIIEAETDEEAHELAKKCPALKHGESVEVVKLGH